MASPCNQKFTECIIALGLWKFVSPLLMIVGISGNLLSLAVLSRKRLRHTTTSVYLRLLAIADTGVLLFPVLRNVIHYYNGVNIRTLSMFGCKFHSWISTSSLAVSIWLLPVIAIDRFILVKHPIWAKVHCTRRSALIVVAVMAAIVLCVNSHILIYQERTEVFAKSNATLEPVLVASVCNPGTVGYKKFYHKTWPVMMFILYTITPLAIVITCNVVLVRELTRRTRINQARRAVETQNEQEQRDLRSITKMLVVVCIFFVIISLPTCVHMIIGPYVFDRKSPHDVAKGLLMYTIVTLILYCNNTVNFILYSFSGRVFRNELLSMLRQAKKRLAKRRIYPTETVSDQTRQMNKATDGTAAGQSSPQTRSTNTNSANTKL